MASPVEPTSPTGAPCGERRAGHDRRLEVGQVAVRPRLPVERLQRQADAAARVRLRPRAEDDRLGDRIDRRSRPVRRCRRPDSRDACGRPRRRRGRRRPGRPSRSEKLAAPRTDEAPAANEAGAEACRALDERRLRGAERGCRAVDDGLRGHAPLPGEPGVLLVLEPVGEERGRVRALLPARLDPGGCAHRRARRDEAVARLRRPRPGRRRGSPGAGRARTRRRSPARTGSRATAPRSRTSRRGCTRRRRARCPRSRPAAAR